MLAFLIALYLFASMMEALEEISAVVAPVMHSGVGILLTIAVTAFVTYRWYRARHSA